MSSQRRCLDCGVLFNTPHEIWCQSSNAAREREIVAKRERVMEEGSSPDAWHKAHYNISTGPLPIMLTYEDIIRMQRMRKETKK